MTRKQEILANVLAWVAMAIVTLVFVNESLNILANQGHKMTPYEQGYQDSIDGKPANPPFGDTAREDYKDGYCFAALKQLFEVTE